MAFAGLHGRLNKGGWAKEHVGHSDDQSADVIYVHFESSIVFFINTILFVSGLFLCCRTIPLKVIGIFLFTDIFVSEWMSILRLLNQLQVFMPR